MHRYRWAQCEELSESKSYIGQNMISKVLCQLDLILGVQDSPYGVLSLPTIPGFHFLPDIPPSVDSPERAIILGNRILDTGIYRSPSAGLQLLAADQVIEQLKSQIASTSGIVSGAYERLLSGLTYGSCIQTELAATNAPLPMPKKRVLVYPGAETHKLNSLVPRSPRSTLPPLFKALLSGIYHENLSAGDELRNILQYLYAPCRLSIFKAHLLVDTILKRVASLRDDVSFLARVQNEIALEEIPCEIIVINVDSGSPLSATTTSKISLIIRHLATASHHIQTSNNFAPALIARHLDRFTDVEPLISSLEELTTNEVSCFPVYIHSAYLIKT